MRFDNLLYIRCNFFCHFYNSFLLVKPFVHIYRNKRVTVEITEKCRSKQLAFTFLLSCTNIPVFSLFDNCLTSFPMLPYANKIGFLKEMFFNSQNFVTIKLSGIVLLQLGHFWAWLHSNVSTVYKTIYKKFAHTSQNLSHTEFVYQPAWGHQW